MDEQFQNYLKNRGGGVPHPLRGAVTDHSISSYSGYFFLVG